MSAQRMNARGRKKRSVIGLLLRPHRFFTKLSRKPQRYIVLTLVLFALLVGVPYWLWQHVSPHVLQENDYQLTSDKIQINSQTPIPAWVRSDIRKEVIASGSLDHKFLILEKDLTRRVADAFSQHPWVKKVQRVTKKYPARVEVALIYRKPVAMIAIDVQGGSLIPVDRDGVLLPGQDFSSLEASQYPRVESVTTLPQGPVGTSWGDQSVVDAARIAAIIGKQNWRKLQLQRIVFHVLNENSDTQEEEYLYELFTLRATRIHWGHAQGFGSAGENSAEEKIAKLLKYYDEYESLDYPADGHELDLRNRLPIIRTPRTATRSQ